MLLCLSLIDNEEDIEYTYPESFEIKIRKIIKQEKFNKAYELL